MAGFEKPQYETDTNGAIVTYVGINKDNQVVVGGDGNVPQTVIEILELDPQATILEIGDIDEHGRIASGIGKYALPESQEYTRKRIVELLKMQSEIAA